MRRILVVLTLAALAPTIGAQGRASVALPPQLAAATRDTLDRLIDSARAAGVPAEPLLAKTAEGVLKGADDARIVRAVRSLVRQLSEARAILPSDASVGTLAAGASALQAGVSSRTLARLSSSAPGGQGDLAVAFVTLADLVASRVPPEAAAASVEQLLKRGAPEAEMSAFRAAVTQDILAGRAPEAALATRTRAVLRNLSAPPARPN